MGDVVPFTAPDRLGGRDDVVRCPCGCSRFLAVVQMTTTGRVADLEPHLVCADCSEFHVLR